MMAVNWHAHFGLFLPFTIMAAGKKDSGIVRLIRNEHN